MQLVLPFLIDADVAMLEMRRVARARATTDQCQAQAATAMS
jgi:hypothetical protein